jgi:hypothetical protein
MGFAPDDPLNAVPRDRDVGHLTALIGDLPTQPSRSVRDGPDSCMRSAPPPSHQCCARCEDWRTQITACADKGISAMLGEIREAVDHQFGG